MKHRFVPGEPTATFANEVVNRLNKFIALQLVLNIILGLWLIVATYKLMGLK